MFSFFILYVSFIFHSFFFSFKSFIFLYLSKQLSSFVNFISFYPLIVNLSRIYICLISVIPISHFPPSFLLFSYFLRLHFLRLLSSFLIIIIRLSECTFTSSAILCIYVLYASLYLCYKFINCIYTVGLLHIYTSLSKYLQSVQMNSALSLSSSVCFNRFLHISLFKFIYLMLFTCICYFFFLF